MRLVVAALRDLPLTTGAFPVVLGLVALGAFLLGLGRRPPWRSLLAVVALAVAAVTAVRLALPASVDVARIPSTFYLWAALPLVALGAAAAAWRGNRPGRRLAALVAIPLTVAFAANQVNAWFAYLPTAADVAGAPVQGEMPWAKVEGRPAASPAVVRLDIPATGSHFHHRPAYVWLPPAAARAGGGPLPVVMMLAGTPGAPDNLLRAADIGRVAERYARAHDGTAPSLVFPDHNGSFAGDSECVDGPRGDAETYLASDVPRFVASRLGGSPQGWGIFGYSEGGTCALVLALRHPRQFSSFVDIGGDLRPNLGSGARRDRAAIRLLFGGDHTGWAEHDPLTLLGQHRYDDLAGLFVAASGDRPALRNARCLLPAARSAGLDVRLRVGHGHHSFVFVAAMAPDAFTWLADRIGAPPTALGPSPLASPARASSSSSASPTPAVAATTAAAKAIGAA
jgi:S-formylglutathione hydrolase FrmB